MTFAENPRPVSYCAGCNMPSLSALAGTACTNAGCHGTFQGAPGVDDWMLCVNCDGRGKVEGAYCGVCHGSGWVPVDSRRVNGGHG
jgi:hypothetical protein